MNKYHLLSLPDDEADAESNFSDSRYVNLNLLRTDHELFKEDDDVQHKVINVRRVNLPHNGEDWELLENGQVVLTLKGVRFTKTERNFLRTIEGMKFIIDGYKAGIKSVVKFKEAMKRI
jgi:hypothetical protein